MEKGIIRYNEEGKPICEICGLAFNKLISHVSQKHLITGKQYKIRFGYDKTKSIMSNSSRNLAKENAQKYPKVIEKLIIKGKKTQFKKGSEGRKKSKISPQTDIKLKKAMFKINKNKKNERKN
tara:strand:+ start:1400 stop:1768 length:369 start_codon:yes stop_codon:yes gene_type:complete